MVSFHEPYSLARYLYFWLPAQRSVVPNRERSLCLAFRRTLADWFQDFGNKILNARAIGFPSQFPQNISMRQRYRLYLLGIILLGCSFTLLADTPALLRSVPAGGCYCHCAESRLRGGCVKMCDSKRYVSRWWATTCAKPHMQTPTDNSHAGPRFPHPGRAEHARL